MLSTHSRLHGFTSYRVPWLYDEESVDVVRFFNRLKASLMPYLYKNAVETSRTRVPMMRSMVLEFTEDRNCAYLASQYMLGDSLLVAPILNEEGNGEYYLPEGIWTNFLTGETREGGRWYSEKHDYLSIPLYAKEGSIVAVGACDENVVYDYAEKVTFRVYALKEGGKAETYVYNTEAVQEASVQVEHVGNTWHISVKSDKPCRVELVKAGKLSCAGEADCSVQRDKGISQRDKGISLRDNLLVSFEKGGDATISVDLPDETVEIE